MKRDKLTIYDVLVRPLVTEKSLALREHRKYVFEVNPLANKGLVKDIKELEGEH
ncbi:MAG: 50S ribosomal protein L23 [Thermotoga sp. 4484_232]|nr:MAG: 50S ribosomal protein L23 [Thermotoga sp. 4484_232]